MGVGKSCLLLKYSDDVFNPEHTATIAVDFKIRILKREEKIVKLQIWDSAGQERFRSITNAYYKGSHGVVIVFDVTNRDSFSNIARWYEDAKNYSNENVKIIIVGNKVDLFESRVISKQEGERFSKKLGSGDEVQYIEASAKEGTNVNTLFLKLVDEVYKTFYNDDDDDEKEETIKKKKNKKEEYEVDHDRIRIKTEDDNVHRHPQKCSSQC